MSVTLRDRVIRNVNELEWVEGKLYANLWPTDWIVIIDPQSGRVEGLIDLKGLFEEIVRTRIPGNRQPDVLNGIAYDPETKRLFVTGKYWPTLFEIELVKRGVQ